MLPDGTFLLEFATMPGRFYYVQYTADFRQWHTSQPAITSNASRVQWIDNGQPKTLSAPSTEAQRFYRVIVLP